MGTTEALEPQPWYATRRFVNGSLALLVIVLAVEAYLAIFIRNNDFLVHRGFGQAFLEGDPSRAGQFHYLPGRGLINAATAWMPYRLARGLHFFAAVGLFGLMLVAWHRLAGRHDSLSGRRGFAAAIFTIVLVGSYIQRDLDECGLQLFLLFFITAGVYFLSMGRPAVSGFWFGLAVAYKVTPILFLPYLLWKRQWRAAAAMAFFSLTWTLAPALHLGWEKTLDCHRQWMAFSFQSMTMEDPSLNPVEPPHHVNQGLIPAIARYIQHYPPEHPLYLEHPASVKTGWLESARAKRGVQVVLLLFAAALAWRFRGRLDPVHAGAELARECAAVAVLCAILSPLCWLQHLVLIVPCVFLWMRAWLDGVPAPRWHFPILAAIALMILVVHREFVSNNTYDLLTSYKPHTIAALMAILLVLTLRSGQGSVSGAGTHPVTDPGHPEALAA